MLIESNSEIWKNYIEHNFVRQLGEGILDRACFVHFVKSVITMLILKPKPKKTDGIADKIIITSNIILEHTREWSRSSASLPI